MCDHQWNYSEQLDAYDHNIKFRECSVCKIEEFWEIDAWEFNRYISDKNTRWVSLNVLNEVI